MSLPKVSNLVDSLSLSLPIQNVIHLRFGRFVVEIATNLPALVPPLVEYFHEFLCEDVGDSRAIRFLAFSYDQEKPYPVHVLSSVPLSVFPRGSKPPKEEYADLPDGRMVRLLDSGLIYLLTPNLDVILGSCLDNFKQVASFLCKRFSRELNYPIGHCSVVSRGERAVAFAGFAGAGKSTLALKLMASEPSLSFLSNDRVIIAPGPNVIGVPRQPRVNPGTLLNNSMLSSLLSLEEVRLYSSLSSESLRLLECKYDVPIHSCFGPGRFILSSSLAAICLLTWDHLSDHNTSIRPVDLAERSDLIPALIKANSVYNWKLHFPPEPSSHIIDGLYLQRDPNSDWDLGIERDENSWKLSDQSIIESLRSIPVYEIAGSVDFDAAVAFCSTLI